MTQSSAEIITIIQPQRGWIARDFAELWRYRELLYFLTWRDIKVRYKQTVLGAAWAILQPVMMMVVFTIVFGRMANVPTGDIPYPIFVYAGLLAWSFFQSAISDAANSLVRSERLITKVYFPRMVIPIGSVGTAFVDLAIQFSVLACLMIYFQIVPSASFLLLIPLTFLTALAALGMGLILAALNVSYRDFRYVVPYFIQLWLFATPSVYMDISTPAIPSAQAVKVQSQDDNASTRAMPKWIEAGMRLNPMTGLIASFRSAILGKPIPVYDLAFSSVVILISLVIGVIVYRRFEDSFADII